MQQLLSAKEVSVALKLPLQRVYDLTRRGAIPAIRILRQYRYDPNALAEWAKRGGTANAEATNDAVALNREKGE